MTNERYAFIEDVKTRKNVAKSGGKKGKSRYGCTLPSDYMSTKEKRDQNSRWISVTFNRPISYDKFLNYSDEDKKTYLQTLIDKYGGSTDKIAKMFGTTEAKIKMYRQELGVCSPIRGTSSYGNYDVEPIWSGFLSTNHFLCEPMSLDDFKTLDWYDQKEYIRFLMETMGIGLTTLSTKLFGYSAPGALRDYLIRKEIPYAERKVGVRTPKENLVAFEKWLEASEIKEEKTILRSPINDTPEEPANLEENSSPSEPDTENAIEEGTGAEKRIEVLRLDIVVTVRDQDQINDILRTLPVAKSGSITFKFEEEK